MEPLEPPIDIDSMRRELAELRERVAQLGVVTGGIEFFLGSVHDAKHSLHNINALLIPLLDLLPQRLTPAMEHARADLLREMDRLNHLIRGSHRILRGARRENPRPVDAWSITREVLDTLEPRLFYFKCEVTVSLNGDAIIMGESDLLFAAFMNIILNSIDVLRHQPGRRRIEIRGTKSDTDQGILWRCKDNGPGIASDLLSQVWEPFFTTKEQGVGLGLFVAKSIVERIHGGIISITSEWGNGAVVKIALPTRFGL